MSAWLRSGPRDGARDLKFTIPNCVKRKGASCASRTTSYHCSPRPIAIFNPAAQRIIYILWDHTAPRHAAKAHSSTAPGGSARQEPQAQSQEPLHRGHVQRARYVSLFLAGPPPGVKTLCGLSVPSFLTIPPPILACWASAGYNAAGCAAIETQLRQCMDGPKPQPASPNTINHHMGRLGKHITYDGKPT